MSIVLNELKIKNFMSVGNCEQSVFFNENLLTLLVGINKDKNIEGSSNGSGKTVCINALSYVIFGEPLSDIKKDNLINKLNTKDMIVSLTFVKDGTEYEIQRGRKPNVFKLLINDTEYEENNEARAASRDTQSEIEHIFNMSHLMFKTIIVLDSNNEPFLKLRDKDRKSIIEELFGITVLSKKADALKLKIKDIKQKIKDEETKINLKISNNERIENNIKNLETRKEFWDNTHVNKIEKLQNEIAEYKKIDIDVEIAKHKEYEEYLSNYNNIEHFKNVYEQLDRDIQNQINELDKKRNLLDEAKNHKCPECKQDIHSDVYEKIVNGLIDDIKNIEDNIIELESNKKIVEDELIEQSLNLKVFDYEFSYTSIHDVYAHASKLSSLEQDLKNEIDKCNPFGEQIENLKTSSLVEISYDDINALTVTEDHMNFLYKLLTNSDSFIRKNIINQNLSFLNKRLVFYAEQLVLLQHVKFNNDLSVTITKSGDEFDFSQLSTGERTRITLALSMSFRDVWERLNTPINVWFFDEIIDSGMDQQGIQDSIRLLEQFVDERKKDVVLISHKLDLAANIENILKATMENGFTEYSK